MHYVNGSLSFSANSAGALSVSPSSTFFTADSSIAQSPSTGTQSLIAGTTTLSSALKVPTASSERLVVNGAIYLSAVPVQARVSYVGPDVQQDYLATDGSTVIYSLLSTSYTVVSLNSLISASPPELFTNSALGLITNAINGRPLYKPQANWQAGAAYVKVVRQTSRRRVVHLRLRVAHHDQRQSDSLLRDDVHARKLLALREHGGRQDLSILRWPDRHAARCACTGGQ